MKKSHNDFREQFEKYKFLVPLGFCLAICFFILTEGGSGSKIFLCLAVMILFCFSIKHHWKMSRDKNYKKRYSQYQKEQKKLPWALRERTPGYDQLIFLITMISFIIGICLLFSFFSSGLSLKEWKISYLIVGSIFLSIFSFFFVSYYLVIYRFRNHNPKKKISQNN